MSQAEWLYRPPTWHPRPARRLPPSKAGPAGTLALSASAYAIGNGSSAATMAPLAAETMNVAVYPLAQWPLTSPLVTVTGSATNSSGNLGDVVDAALTAGTAYRVVIYHPASGEAWVTTITAT